MLKGYHHPQVSKFFNAIKKAGETGKFRPLEKFVDESPSLINACNQDNSALSLALELDALEIARFLLERGADPNMERYTKEGDSRPALMHIQSRAALDLLLAHGAQLSFISQGGASVHNLFVRLPPEDFVHLIRCAEAQGFGLSVRSWNQFPLERYARYATQTKDFTRFIDVWERLKEEGLIDAQADRKGEQRALFSVLLSISGDLEPYSDLVDWLMKEGLKLDHRLIPAHHLKDQSNQLVALMKVSKPDAIERLLPHMEVIHPEVADMLGARMEGIAGRGRSRMICLLDQAGKFTPGSPALGTIAFHALHTCESMEDFLYLSEVFLPKAGLEKALIEKFAQDTLEGKRMMMFYRSAQKEAFLNGEFHMSACMKGVACHQAAVSDIAANPQSWMDDLMVAHGALGLAPRHPWKEAPEVLEQLLLDGVAQGYPMPSACVLEKADAQVLSKMAALRMSLAMSSAEAGTTSRAIQRKAV